eukprot:1482512-Heterocapsa_arctica.AAC.1
MGGPQARPACEAAAPWRGPRLWPRPSQRLLPRVVRHLPADLRAATRPRPPRLARMGAPRRCPRPVGALAARSCQR